MIYIIIITVSLIIMTKMGYNSLRELKKLIQHSHLDDILCYSVVSGDIDILEDVLGLNENDRITKYKNAPNSKYIPRLEGMTLTQKEKKLVNSFIEDYRSLSSYGNPPTPENSQSEIS